MFWTGMLLIVLGFILFVVGWVLNTSTPVQQPLPVVGAVMIVLGIICLIFVLGRTSGSV